MRINSKRGKHKDNRWWGSQLTFCLLCWMLGGASPLRQLQISADTNQGDVWENCNFCPTTQAVLRGVYLSILRRVTVSESARHHQHQRLVLQVHHVIVIHRRHLQMWAEKWDHGEPILDSNSCPKFLFASPLPMSPRHMPRAHKTDHLSVQTMAEHTAAGGRKEEEGCRETTLSSPLTRW